MKKEFIIFIGIFLFLAIALHFGDWTTDPVGKITRLPDSSSYGLGWEHPIVYTLALYILIWIPRAVIKLFSKKKVID